MSDLRKVSRALISVSDKTGIVEFARALSALRALSFSLRVAPFAC